MSAAQRGRFVPATLNVAMDHSIRDIILIAAHVKLYEFILALGQWTETGVEGHLFVIKRNTWPHSLLIILNSRNTGYFVEIIGGHFELSLQQPYLVYQNGVSKIYGIWISETQEFLRAAEVLSRIVSTYAQPPSSCAQPHLQALPSIVVFDVRLELSFAAPISARVRVGINSFNLTCVEFTHNAPARYEPILRDLIFKLVEMNFQSHLVQAMNGPQNNSWR